MTDNRTTELLPMERFRAALEKRGIEYETDDDECAYGEPRCTVFKAHIGGDRETDIVIVGVKDWYFDGKPTPWLDVEFHNVLTPEQAIAATLGNPTCEYVIEDNMNESEGMGDVWFRCTNCDMTYDYYADDWLMEQNHCPHCGARIRKKVDE